ncbi:TniQ family protein [Enterocloster clostridioformis]
MLQYFPTPYPDELWYSVMCRYHVRSGNGNLLKAKNRYQFQTQIFFPDSSILKVVSDLPEGLYNVRDIILNHTLLPYFVRMYPLDRKKQMLNELCTGTVWSDNPEWAVIARTMPKLRYCPDCIKADQKRYGESYWHREHQIPYMSICRKHGCRLKENSCKLRQEYTEGPILPEFIADGTRTEYFTQPYEKPLADMLYSYLTLPIDAGPTQGYSNLFYGLEQEYQHIRNSRVITLDTHKLYTDLKNYYGEKITRGFFGKSMPQYVPMKLRNWEFTTPERYALLAAMIGQAPEITFGENQRISHETEPIRVREIRFPTMRQKAALMKAVNI